MVLIYCVHLHKTHLPVKSTGTFHIACTVTPEFPGSSCSVVTLIIRLRFFHFLSKQANRECRNVLLLSPYLGYVSDFLWTAAGYILSLLFSRPRIQFQYKACCDMWGQPVGQVQASCGSSNIFSSRKVLAGCWRVLG